MSDTPSASTETAPPEQAAAEPTTEPAGQAAPPAPPPSTRTGDIREHVHPPSRALDAPRRLLVYLPPGYDADPARRYPVLYLHDGQNVFDAATAFGGNEWRVDETAERLIGEGAIEPLIIVAVDNAGEGRIQEYTPSRDRKHDAGGGADRYGRLLFDEIKPFIDATYRTLPDAANTGIGGSSLGGLLSLYLALRKADRVQRVAVLSPSLWWDGETMLRRVRALRRRPPLRLWLSVGTGEGEEVVAAARRMRDALAGRGWTIGGDLRYTEFEHAGHSETAWAEQTPHVLQWLFGRDGTG